MSTLFRMRTVRRMYTFGPSLTGWSTGSSMLRGVRKGDMALVDPWRLVFAEPLADIVSVLHEGAAILDEYHPGVGEEDFQYQLMLCFEKEGLIMDLIQTAPDHQEIGYQDYVQ